MLLACVIVKTGPLTIRITTPTIRITKILLVLTITMPYSFLYSIRKCYYVTNFNVVGSDDC